MASARASGVLLHPTSLPGPFGSGELGEHAFRWLDWLAEAGQRWWQVLPLGPTGYGDSPYQSFSSFAGNPNLISLARLKEEGWLTAEELAGSPDGDPLRIDFGPLIEFRAARLASAAERWLAAADAEQRQAFEAFRTRNAAWLDDFALFMALKRAHGGQPWNAWAAPLRRREPDALVAARLEHADAIQAESLLQWWFDRHWGDVRRRAAELGIGVLGDLPIFVAFDSADTWAAQALFFLDDAGNPTVVAGVPPDYFSETGQRWGNPLYRWDRHAADGYAWWIARLRRCLELYDLVRIDHFRGFEAYWEIPASEETAVHGRWVEGPGQALFDAFATSFGAAEGGAFGGAAEGRLPIVAEDLGVVTPGVERLRDHNGLPGMKVLQFAWGGDPDDPFLPHTYPANAVVYTGTHDNDTTIGWYAQAPEAERDRLRRYLSVDGEDVAWDLLRAAQASPADLAIAPMQDLLRLGHEARMNLPGAPSGNWGWRFGWEQLPEELAGELRAMGEAYGR